jgi:hypothetical protein
MKTILIFLLIITVGHFPVYAQESPSWIPLNDIEIGNRQYYLIQTNTKIYHARIISIDKKDVLLINSDGKSRVISPDDIVAINKKSFNSPVSLGIGFGIPYGLFGFNGDINLYNNFYLSTGIGVGFGTSPWLCIGGKYYLRSGSYRWRPRVSAYYGHIGGIKIENYQGGLPKIKEGVTGSIIGIGQQWMVGIKKAWGIDLDVIYIMDKGKFDKRMEELKDEGYYFDYENSGVIKISLGVRYIF